MSSQTNDEIKEAIRKAVTEAINEMGLELFKKTSFFVSNMKEAQNEH